MADNSQKIAELEEILNAGVTQVGVDGTNTSFDLNEVRKQLEYLKRTDTTGQYSAMVRPKFGTVRLDNSW